MQIKVYKQGCKKNKGNEKAVWAKQEAKWSCRHSGPNGKFARLEQRMPEEERSLGFDGSLSLCTALFSFKRKQIFVNGLF